jgi:hypothetical protein
VSKTAPNTIKFSDLPAIGAALGGGIFVGAITQPDGTHVAVDGMGSEYIFEAGEFERVEGGTA